MSSLAHWVPKFKPPDVGLWIAAFLELAMLTELMTHHAVVGITVWVLYFVLFSATRTLIFKKEDD